MNNNDLLTILGCGALGYGIIHLALNKPAPPTKAAPPPPQQPQATFAPAWARVLELPADASLDEIREAYRRLMSQYHPDKVASLGRELRELAESKSKEISVAYQEALAARGARE
jgi:DnaJ-domain-containing protein 1